MKQIERDKLKEWDSFYKNITKSRNIDYNEAPLVKKERITVLLKDFEAFSKYYFPNVCKADFAKWHKKYVKYVIENDQCYAVVMVSRDMAKSSVTMLLVLFLYYKKEFKSLGYFSHIQDQAEMLLSAIKIAFEKNEALIRDFGNQRGPLWTSNRFTTVTGASFRAIGAGQNPRGEKNEDSDRFDIEIFDDFDDPEVCRNPERLDNNWKYVQGDCYAAMHVSGKRRVIHLNNKIDEDCIIERAYNHAGTLSNFFRILVNLVDAKGNSNWPEAYTNKQCQEIISLVADEADTEYMNNPVKKGTAFKKEWFVFQKLPALNKYPCLIAYLDGGFKKTKTSDTKALVLVGMLAGQIHVHKVYVDNVTVETMVDWHYDLHKFLVANKATCQWWMEEVFLLGLLHDHFDAAIKRHGFRLPIMGDKRKKADKDLRIANTAGYYERGNIIFDERLKEDRFMKRLVSQYLRFRMGLRNIEKDGPDAMEGGIFKLQEMFKIQSNELSVGTRYKNNKKV